MFRKPLFRHLPLILLICVGCGCKVLESMTRPKVLKSSDGRFEITIPAGWRENAGLNSSADIKASNTRQEMYVLVMIEPKADFADDVTFDQFTELTLQSMRKNVASAESTPPIPLKINGNTARQYEVQGVVNGVKI